SRHGARITSGRACDRGVSGRIRTVAGIARTGGSAGTVVAVRSCVEAGGAAAVSLARGDGCVSGGIGLRRQGRCRGIVGPRRLTPDAELVFAVRERTVRCRGSDGLDRVRGRRRCDRAQRRGSSGRFSEAAWRVTTRAASLTVLDLLVERGGRAILDGC